MHWTRGTLLVSASFILALSAQPAALAETTWKVGDQVAAPDVFSWDDRAVPIVRSFRGSEDCEFDATAAVKRAGDWVYVKDLCADGRSAVAKVTWPGEVRVCRNKEGQGTWVRCNWDWPEDEAKQFTAGVYNGDTGYLNWDDGRSRLFNQ